MKKVTKALKNLALFPFWLATYAVRGAFYVAGAVTSIFIVRVALSIALGIVILGTLVSGLWSYVIILGIPLFLVYVMPHISEYVSAFCCMITDRISDYWHTPAGYSY